MRADRVVIIRNMSSRSWGWLICRRLALRNANEARNHLVGTIVNWRYIGTSYHVLVETQDVGCFAANVPASRLGEPPAIGSRTAIGWDPDATVMIESD